MEWFKISGAGFEEIDDADKAQKMLAAFDSELKRIADSSSDPIMSAEEKRLLDDLKNSRGIFGQAAINEIFNDQFNIDGGGGELSDQWYTHHFALTGGQIMELPSSGSIYGKAITYTTFFQEAVRKIG